MQRHEDEPYHIRLFKKGISNNAAQYFDVIGIYLDAMKDNPEEFSKMAVSIAKALLDDYTERTAQNKMSRKNTE